MVKPGIFGTGPSTFRSPTEQTMVQPGSSSPTPQRFSAKQDGEIENVNLAYNEFKARMSLIGNKYTGEKQKNFMEKLSKCTIERFTSLSTERGRLTIFGVREAETMLQSEFEGIHESDSISRPTTQESQENNVFDGRFRIGILSGDSNTLNGEFTDIDAKLLVSDSTLQFQATERQLSGQRNPNRISMQEQGQNTGASVVAQKFKHCNPNKVELPSSSKNVKHIINLLELSTSETNIAKKSVTDGAKIAWAKKLNVPEQSVSDQAALQGIIFLNEDNTIERVN